MKKRHSQIQEFVKSYYQDNGCGPTTREIAEGIGVKSTSTVHRSISQMERLGLIVKGSHSQPRSVRLPDQEQTVFVLYGHWHTPGDDGANVWGVFPKMEDSQKLMYSTGEIMVEEAVDAGVEFNDIKTSETMYAAQDGEGNFVRLYISEHKVEKSSGGKENNAV